MRFGIVAGEASGDILGAGLIRAIKRVCPDAQFEGIGGPLMIAEGFHSHFPMERLSVMGFIEPLGRLPELLRIKKTLEQLFIQDKPDVFIGIDSPGFNLRIEQVLHDAGIKTVHYVSPSVWAWGKKRIHKIAKAVDMVLALLPFETKIYDEHKVPARFIGHPLADLIDPELDDTLRRSNARKALGLSDQDKIIALMPGSRRNEIERLGVVFIQTAKQALIADSSLRFVIPCANPNRKEQVEQLLRSHDCGEQFLVYEGQSHETMSAANIVLMASGTATLEGLLLRRPMIVAYSLSPLTWMLASRLVKIPYVSLPNLLAGEELIAEFLQDEANVQNLGAELSSLLADTKRQERLQQRFAGIHQQLRRNADVEAARAVLEVAQYTGSMEGLECN
ncbi:MAG: lipid-A-disaccharide synthase [Pseudohongiellaceae bacterium]|nr:lipid-A-disaccharide synthase [Pseudohongiellaceae bacterium]